MWYEYYDRGKPEQHDVYLSLVQDIHDGVKRSLLNHKIMIMKHKSKLSILDSSLESWPLPIPATTSWTCIPKIN
jgi:hypothetical protein